MDNGYVDGLRKHDSRPRSPVIIPHNLSELRKKILFENTLLEERTLHEFSAGKGDGAGVDTGSAPLKPLTSPTPSPTTTPTPTPTPAPAGIVVASTNAVNITGIVGTIVPNGTYTKVTANGTRVGGSAGSDKLFLDTGLVYLKEAGYGDADYPTAPYGYILIPPNTTFTATFFNTLESVPFWRVGRVYGLFGEESSSFEFPLPNTNPSTDATIIPTSGWDFDITITAA